ncbi:homoserine kinase [Polymorphobacter glacialis]|uniref:Homoserine kinase n=1 Tax=Sandarakinorhabdus glacialis TaxID=1614636 RepID=A0A916ZI32_9SPHN|nr:homoserine kinase [Polymorphobacter glacialis]GGD99175.1 homoserine kinase [Polymorphobacter glacialis]
MAVYTPVTAADLTAFLQRYDIGVATSFKGIAEGVQNSNFLLETTCGRYVLTLYETRVEIAALPWFLRLTTYLADKGLPVPRPIVDREGVALQVLNGRPACVIAFVTGVSVTEPTPEQARAAGAAMGALHRATADFGEPRVNDLGQPFWAAMAARCEGRTGEIDAALPGVIATGLAATADWPVSLASAVVHTDLFPDNVLMLGGAVTGLIDFYFACTDLRAFDYAVTHSAWCFSDDGARYFPERAAALAAGYGETYGLTEAEVAALPRLGVGAALRFVLTRAYDWLNTPADALVTKKDPMAFARRLDWYAAATPDMVLGV